MCSLCLSFCVDCSHHFFFPNSFGDSRYSLRLYNWICHCISYLGPTMSNHHTPLLSILYLSASISAFYFSGNRPTTYKIIPQTVFSSLRVVGSSPYAYTREWREWNGCNNSQANIYPSSTEVYTKLYMTLGGSHGLPQQALAEIPEAPATTTTPL